MNKIRIFGVAAGLIIVIIFLTKIDYNNLNWPRNVNYCGIIIAALFFCLCMFLTWEKKK